MAGGLNSVLRLRTDPFPRTTVGGIFTSLDTGDGHNRVVGGDLQVRFGGSSYVQGWVARSSGGLGVGGTSGGGSGQRGGSGGSGGGSDFAPVSTAASIEADLRSSLLSAGAGFTRIPDDFSPALGFVRRRDMQRLTGSLAVFPRFERSRWARQLIVVGNGEHITGLDGVRHTVVLLSHNMLTFQTGDRAMLNIRRRSESLQKPVRIQGRELAVGDYVFDRAEFRFNTNDSRVFSARGGFFTGGFWGGDRTELSIGGMWKTGPHLTVGGDYTWNDVSLPAEDGDFTTRLVGVTFLGAVSRALFANALVQYDDVSNVVQANVRIDWIHTPGSDLFVVFDTGYLTGDLFDPRTERWQRRTGVVKLTYLKAF